MSAVKLMGRPKTNGLDLEGVKIEKPTLDKARIAFTHIKVKESKGKGYTLAQYISECLRDERSLIADHAAYIREEAKKLSK